jgi:zinc and cadmium transporter
MLGVSASVWGATLLSVALVSLLSFAGVFVLVLRRELLSQLIPVLVSFAVGALLGDALLHILPELSEGGGVTAGIAFVTVAGIVGFFVLEKFIHWHHSLHTEEVRVIHPVAWANVIGDGVHNFVDGALIAGAFLASIPLGITTTLAVVMHEIPQEFGDLGVLIHAGLSARKALLFNFLSALTAVLGGVLTLLLADVVDGVARPLLAITAGAFIYIAGADLIPELHRETRTAVSLLQFTGMIAGFAIMGLLLLVE